MARLGPRAWEQARAWAELLRLPALFTVPGDALAGAAAIGVRPNSRTLLAIGSSVCLYEAGMALNDWADRAEDAVERPHRPLPSGRVRPAAALVAAGALTAAGLALADRAGRPALAVAVPLAATVWAYDLALKRTPAGPAAMATARGLDVLLGATATGGTSPSAHMLPGVTAACRTARRALPSALAVATHTLAMTMVSRGETQGGSPVAPLTALATTGALAWALANSPAGTGQPGHPAAARSQPAGDTPTAPESTPLGGARASLDQTPGVTPSPSPGPGRPGPSPSPGPAPRLSPTPVTDTLRGALTLAYAATSARPLFHAVLNPSPPLTQRAVGGGIRAMIPLQATLAARAGAPVTALLTAALAPAARKFARKVSVT
ncbi:MULTISPECIES: SCO3242 family prenyltransferase [unclassified Streptomyces]|uniref:SCO3242 family prenyltransferase n=1 Tax=unclassified Streptomyces TaxID=2593676 RepID=UPI002E810B4B|nr:UbiA family prenyltransferase [Streptomyces sp. NBC_00589]WTI34803.1 UbiA family prenyltransferase [Streptomyces sp. NBC_00775]WUB31523.1 UbiA family prenyltransferase [Streptomyces sp. NBC_00589]